MKLGNDLIHADALRRELDYLIEIADVREMDSVVYGLNKAKKALNEAARVIVPKGYWLASQTTFPGVGLTNYECSYCGKVGGTWKSRISAEETFKYCPWCGAEIVGVLEGEAAEYAKG